MKLIQLTPVIFVCLALMDCKKEKDTLLTAGEEKRMIVTSINESMELNENELLEDQKIMLNLDQEGIFDIVIKCEHSYSSTLDQQGYHIYLTQANDEYLWKEDKMLIYLSEKENLIDSTEEQVTYEIIKKYSCEHTEDVHDTSVYRTLAVNKLDETISYSDFQKWKLSSSSDKSTLHDSRYRYSEKSFSYEDIDYDRWVNKTTIRDIDVCTNFQGFNTPSYIIFRKGKNEGSDHYFGWIEFELKQDEFVVYRTAISEKPIK